MKMNEGSFFKAKALDPLMGGIPDLYEEVL